MCGVQEPELDDNSNILGARVHTKKMTRVLPQSVWLNILVRLDGCDLDKVLECGLLDDEWEDDSLWAALCKKRLALHGPDIRRVGDIYGGRRYPIALLTRHLDLDSDVVSHREWYMNATRMRGSGRRVDFKSLLRGVYKIHATPQDESDYPVLSMTSVQNGIGERYLILKSGKERISCNRYLHMIQSGPLRVQCSDSMLVELERKDEVPLIPTHKAKSGRIDQPDGTILVSACSWWGTELDDRDSWWSVYSEKSPFGQVMFMQHCSWANIFCLFKGMRSDTYYECSWKSDVPDQGDFFCSVKIFRHDPLRPVPVMAPVGFTPDLSKHNEWDAWRDWYAAGKDENTPGFLDLRRDSTGPEYCESPIRTFEIHRWNEDGISGIIEPFVCGEDLVDIQLSFIASSDTICNGYLDYFALRPLMR